MTSRSHKPLILILLVILVALMGSALWIVQRGLQSEEARANPTVVQITPRAGEPVSRATTMEFVFDQQMDHASVEQALTLSPTFEYDLLWDDEGGGEQLIIQPIRALAWDTTYRARIGTTAQNVEGRPLLESAQVEVQTASEVHISEALPAPKSDAIDPRQPIAIRFDRALVAVASLEEQSQLPQPILITPPVEGVGRWIEPDLYVFYPTKGLARGTAYEVTVSPLVSPGNELPETFEWSFVTEGPRLEATFPYDGASEVTNATAIRLLFAQPMDRDSVEENFRLSRAEEPTPIAGEYRWDDDQTLLFVPRRPLDAASEYQIRVSEGATTPGGTRGLLSPYRAIFTTVDFLRAESVQPAPGSIEVSTVPTDTALTVQFNHPVVPLVGEAAQGALPTPLQISPALEGQGEWVTTSLYRFRPSEPLEPSTEYVVTVGSDLQDTLGSYQDETYSWSFTTEFPRVIRVEPSNPRRHVPAEGPIALRFNQPMNQANTETAFSLTGPAGAVPGRIRWVEGGTVLRFVPDQPLTREAEYTLTLAAGARGAQGGESRNPFTAPVVAAPELRVLSVSPAPGASGVNVYDGIQITFNTALDPATFDPAQPLPALKPYLSIEPAPKGALGSCCYDAETLILSIYAENGFAPNTDYTVTVRNIRDESGQTLEPYSWQFRTGALPPILTLASQSAGMLATYTPFAPPLQLINYQAISRLDFSLYRVDEATLLRLLTGAARWEEWSQYSGDPSQLVKQWSVQPEDASEQMTLHTEPLSPDGALEPGAYFFHVGTAERNEWSNTPIQTQQLLAVTTVNLTLKHATSELLLWAVDMESGEPLPNVRLRVFSEATPSTDGSAAPSGPLVAEGTTDGEGLLRVPLSAAVLPTQNLVALAYDEAGSVVGIAADALSGFAFDQTRLSIPNNPLPPQLYGTLYTERPIYRPGQTVYFRGILRERQGSALVQPTLNEVTLNIQGADGSILESRAIELSPFGTFYGEFVLDEDAATGQYILNLSQDELQRCYSGDYCEPEVLYSFFNVAEYEVPEVEVQVRAEPESVVSGEPASAMVSASYYAGGALSGAPFEWRLYSRPYPFSVPGLIGYWTWQAYDTPPYFESVSQPSIGRSGTGTLDAAGQATLPISTELIWQSDLADPSTPAKALSSQVFTIESDVKDLNNKTISGRDELVVHAGDFYIGLRPEGFMGQAGQPMTIHVATADTEGTLEGGHELSLELSAREYYNVRDTSNRFGWTTHFTDTLVTTERTSTGEDGFATVTLTPQEGGSYTVLARGTDARGNEVVSRAFFWVSSGNYVNWEQEGDNYIGLIADKTEYQVGDVARILVPTPHEGMSALITQERFGLDDVQVRELATTSETIEIPITEEMIPNMIISVVAAKGVTDESPLPRLPRRLPKPAGVPRAQAAERYPRPPGRGERAAPAGGGGHLPAARHRPGGRAGAG